MELRDTDLGISRGGRPGEVMVVGKIIQGKYGSVRRSERGLLSEPKEANSEVLQTQVRRRA